MALYQYQAIQQAHKTIQRAQSVLAKPNINNKNAALSYMRLCCSAIAQLRLTGLELAPELDPQRPYLELLERLYNHDPSWGKSCTVSSTGALISSDIWTDKQLEIIRRSSQQISRKAAQQS